MLTVAALLKPNSPNAIYISITLILNVSLYMDLTNLRKSINVCLVSICCSLVHIFNMYLISVCRSLVRVVNAYLVTKDYLKKNYFSIYWKMI